MAVRVVGVASALPSNAYPQREIREVMRRWIGGDRRTERLLERVYAASAIDRRWSVLAGLSDGSSGDRGDALFVDERGAFRRPGTAERNARYVKEAPPLAETAARAALERVPTLGAGDVTHVITVSCTGFHAPGTDDHLVRALGLHPGTERYHVGFMGCYAAFPALRMARAFCRSDPDAVVLVVCVELCTLHLAPTRDLDNLLATSVFADGAAAAVVTARALRGRQLPLEILASATTLTDDSEREMAWTIGDHGFDMVLSSYVPRVLEAEVEGAVAPLLHAGGVTRDEVAHWAVHPGGRAILDKVAKGLELEPWQIAASREVLAHAGNMSSGSVLFVLERLVSCPNAATARAGLEPGDRVAALAFGPGLTVDAALFRAA